MKILVTGGAGFIGSHFVDTLIRLDQKDEILVLDNLTYAGNLKNLEEAKKYQKFEFIKGDICSVKTVEGIKDIDLIVNFAAESHVDRSINDSMPFIKSNVLGTNVLLEYARKNDSVFCQISSDEVYGSVTKKSKEDDVLNPSSPYSASKASADLLVQAFHKTYGLNTRITRSCNNFGSRQYPEKLIPLAISKLMKGEKIPAYGNGLNQREWIHVQDNCNAINAVIEEGKRGEIYNIGSGTVLTNIELLKEILACFKQPESMIEFVEDRLGHDFRYSTNSDKIKALGWKPEHNFKLALQETINWYWRQE